MIKGVTPLTEVPEICASRQTVRFAKREMKLPDLSFRMLRLLSERAPDPVPFEEIERVVWEAQVSRETIKQRVKLLRDSLVSLGVASGGVPSARNIGYRLVQTFPLYEAQVAANPRSGLRQMWGAIFGSAICLSAILAYLFVSNEPTPASQISLAIHSHAPIAESRLPSSDRYAAHQRLISEFARMSNLHVMTNDDSKHSADLSVSMESIPDGPYETLSLKLVENETGTPLWSESFSLDQDGYEKPVSIFAADALKQIAALGLQPGPDISDEKASRARQLYLSALPFAKANTEADLLAATDRLDVSLALRPAFSLARSLRARIAARLVMDHRNDERLVLDALEEAQSLVDAHPNVPEFQRTLATVQTAIGSLPEALANLEQAQKHMPFLQSEIAALKRRIAKEQP
jgi:DNA-binding winged helix-turn-helix (wHTH) protein